MISDGWKRSIDLDSVARIRREVAVASLDKKRVHIHLHSKKHQAQEDAIIQNSVERWDGV